MRFQFDYLGGPTPQNTGVLVCPKCEDSLDINNKLLILPPDPAPFRNTRPYPYAIDEGFSPDQEIGIQLIINFVMAAAVDVSGLAPGVPGAWLFDDPDQSSEMLTAGLM